MSSVEWDFSVVLDVGKVGDMELAASWFYEGKQPHLTICVAGPRESEAPGIYAKAKPVLVELFDRVTSCQRENENAE